MSEFDPLFSAAEQKYGLPPGILKATAYVESKFDPNATSPTGVRGLMQINGANAKHYGGNRLDPTQAVDMAGRLWSENMKATGGDIDKSAVRYNGGGDPHYVAKLHGYLSQQGAPQAPSDPIEAALSGGNAPAPRAAPASNDPIELALSGAHGGGNAPAGNPSAQEAGNNGSARPAGGNLASVQSGQPTGPILPQTGRMVEASFAPEMGQNAGPVGGAPDGNRPDAGNSTGFLQDAGDAALGAAGGLAEPLGTAATIIGKGLDATGLTTGRGDNALKNSDFLQAYLRSKMTNADGWPQAIGRFGGEVAATLPLAAIGLPEAEGASALVKGLAKYGSYAGQGAVAGLALSGGHNMLHNAEFGAPFGVAGGVIGERVLAPIASRLGETALGQKATEQAKRLAAFVRGAAPEVERIPVAGSENSGVEQSIRRGSETFDAYRARRGAEFDAKQAQAEAEAKAAMEANPDGPIEVGMVGGRNDYVNGVGDPNAPLNVKSYADAYQRGEGRGTGPADLEMQQFAANNGPEIEAEFQRRAGQSNASPSPLDLANALKAHGARNGIEATQALPAKVAEDAAALKAKGVPDDHALNEASIRYVGGNPTVGAVTRDRATMQAEKEGAKVTSDEGAALAARAAENNAALHDTVQETVNGYGGVPAQGEASQTVAESLAKASDAAKAKVSKLYDTARTTDGEAKLNTDGLRELLKSPEMATPTSPAVQQLANGIRSHLEGVDATAGTTLRTPAQLEDLRQLANSAYDNMGGPVNGAIRKVGGALNDSLDQLDSVSGAYKAARAAHRDWASQYADPEGVSRIISRDAGGNFLNEDNWRRADNGLIGTTSDRAFAQVTRQLQTNGDTQTLDRLKAEIVQRAYQRATNSAADESGNPVFSAKQWHTELNKIGMPKLKAIFSNDEIAHLATVGRAARALHESVPGTVNGSGTSAALINALSGVKNGKEIGHVASALGKVAKVGGHIASSTIPMGHVAVEGISHVAGKVSGARSTAAANKALAKAIRETLDPAAARTAANENAVAAVAKGHRQNLARGLGRVAAPSAAASQRNR